MGKLFVNSIDGLTTERDFDVYFAPKNGQRANEVNIGRSSKRLKKEINIVQDMISILVNRPIRNYDIETIYQYGELVQLKDSVGDTEFIEYWQSQIDNNLALNPHWVENATGTYWKQFEPFGNYTTEEYNGEFKNDIKFGYNMHNSGYFIVGERMGNNISIDRDEIAARTFNVETKEIFPSLLRMQADGGMLTIHGNLWEIPSEKHRVSVFTDDGRFILGNKETINTDDSPHLYDKCYKFECWGDALITQDARFGGWVSFDKGFSKVPSITVQDGIDTSLSDRLVIRPSSSNGKTEINAMQPILEKGSTLFLQNHTSQLGDIIINSGANVIHITNEGRIGIKKLSPDFALDVKGQIVSNDGNSSALQVINGNSAMILNTCTDKSFYINAYCDSHPESLHIQNAGGDTFFNCSTGTVHITSSGRIGVGLINPSCSLDVRGSAIISGSISSSSTNVINSAKTLRIETVAGSNDFRIMTADNAGGTSTLHLQDNEFCDLIVNGKDSACQAAARTFHLMANGNLGIGKLNPNYKLYVNGTSYMADKLYIESSAGGAGTALETNGRIKAVFFDGNAASALLADKATIADTATIANRAILADTATISDKATWATTAGAISAAPADIAERYEADDIYEVGTILSIGGDKEVTLGNSTMPLAGVVSINPAIKLNVNEYNDNEYNPFIALKGRVPVKVSGTVTKGQYVIVDKNGSGVGVNIPTNMLLVVGVALSDSKDGLVEVKV